MTALLHLLNSQPDWSELEDDGDTIEHLGRVYRVRIEPDPESIADIADHGDVYGHTEWTYDNDYGPVRPSGFTGNAEIIRRDLRATLWWEPYDVGDIPGGRDGQAFRDYRQNVRDIMEFGFCSIGLELLGGKDAYGRPVVVDAAWLGGIEPFPDDAYKREVLSDLWSELRSEQS